MARARLADVFQALNERGCVRFRHLDCHTCVVYGDGRQKTLDGRSYQAFLKTMADHLQRTETGSFDTHDLIIEWRRHQKTS